MARKVPTKSIAVAMAVTPPRKELDILTMTAATHSWTIRAHVRLIPREAKLAAIVGL